MSTGPDRRDVVVVGAGLAGLAAARHVAQGGLSVEVIEKSGGLGGRLATRRVDELPVDHGCPVLEVPAEGPLADEVAALDPVQLDAPGRPLGLRLGMTALPKRIAGDLDVARRARVTALVPSDDGVVVLDDVSPSPRHAACVILAAPGPQAAALLRTAGQEGRAAALDAALYDPALIMLAGLPAGLDRPAIRPGGGSCALVVDEGAKRPIPDGGTVIAAHLTAEVSRDLIDDPDDDRIMADYLPAVLTDLGVDGEPSWTQLKRWRYATPRGAAADGSRPLEGRILLCGDALTGTGLNRVFDSGLRAGDAALRMLRR